MNEKLTEACRSDQQRLPVDPRYSSIAEALERKGQLILYGPPGTGKTFHVRRFAVWWLLRQQGLSSDAQLADTKFLQKEETQLIGTAGSGRVWWVVASTSQNWEWEFLFKKGRETFSEGRLPTNFKLIQVGDLVVGYQATPDRRVKCLAFVVSVNKSDSGAVSGFDLEPLVRIKEGPTWDDLSQGEIWAASEPIRNNNQGTLFALTRKEVGDLADRVRRSNPEAAEYLKDESGSGIGALTWVTFHPSYAYEDFVEGLRPYEVAGGQVGFRMEDGLFKRLCKAGSRHPKRTFLLVIDEINRAHVAKVFGELITVLENDKRELSVTLPQSKDLLVVPKNLFILGTMNTADRSIKLLDAALRRRFAFKEFMPDLNPLEGYSVQDLPLSDFLGFLNDRIARRLGREKQLGQSYLLERGKPVTEPPEFARKFREEILPLLQEYCYENYAALADYVGTGVVDVEAQTIRDVVEDPDALIKSLKEWMSTPA